jgi:hypothetical protein
VQWRARPRGPGISCIKNFSFKFYLVGAQLFDSSLHTSPMHPNLLLQPYHLFSYHFKKSEGCKILLESIQRIKSYVFAVKIFFLKLYMTMHELCRMTSIF